MKTRWKEKYTTVKVKKFTSPTGPTCILPSMILEVFLLFFTDELLGMIAEQTNLYASQTMTIEAYSKWAIVTVEELKAYLGFYILMGLVRMPSMYDYWSTNPIYRYAPIADRITRDRFLDIHKYLHFADNTSMPAYSTPTYDKLGKIRPLVSHLNSRFLTLYSPHCQVSVDEVMVKFKDQSSLKQYMPKKPTKRGFKVWMRADAINGYISQLEVYTGKVTGKVEKGLGKHVVENLTRPLVGKHHEVYCDNYFTSIPLLLSLRHDGLYGCGTLKSNRLGFPSQFVPKLSKGLPQRGDSMSLQHGELVVHLWQDTKPVVVMSSLSQAEKKTTVKRKQKKCTTIDLPCPVAIELYNKFMGGVDRNDQLRNYHTYNFKSQKFYKYIFFFLFHLSVTHSYILTKHHSQTITVRNIKQFREKLAMALIGDYRSRKRSNRQSITPAFVKPSCLQHFPRKGSDTVHRCYYCSHICHRRRQTTWHCHECNVFLWHTGKDDDCFYLYHTTL